jgi:hypothetical protein
MNNVAELSQPKNQRRSMMTLRAFRFCGHDGAMESFFVNEDALKRIEPRMQSNESRLLCAFNLHRDLIYAAATKAYRRGRKGSPQIFDDAVRCYDEVRLEF